MRVNPIYKKITSIILVLSFIVPTLFFTAPKKAHALIAADVIGGPSNVVSEGFNAISSASNLISSVAQKSLAFKEYVLDPLTVLLREVLIQSITASIVNWINSGFEGEPAFITDLNGFLLNVGDQVVGRYIQGSKLAGICSPFKINVRIALALDYYSKDNVSCTLTGALDNINGAFGDFSSGNAWDQWYNLSINSNNNAFGAFLNSRQALQQDIATAQSEQVRILDWGRGFRSYQVCDNSNTGGKGASNISANIGRVKINCRIATPGIVISQQLSKVLGTGLKQLELADEINEIIGALLGQLVKQVLGGSNGGLSGLSRSVYNKPSYTDRLLHESRSSSSISGKSLEAIRSSLQNENEYKTAKQTSLDAVRVAKDKLETLQQCYIEKASQNQTLWGVIGKEGDKKIISFTTPELINNADNASSTITNTLLPLQDRLTKDIAEVNTIIGQLIVIRTNVENTKSAGDLSNAIGKYQTLQQSGQIKNVKDIQDAKLERDGYPGEQHSLPKGIVRDMAKLNNKTDSDLKICQSLIFTYEPNII